jgi:hypothetical protein
MPLYSDYFFVDASGKQDFYLTVEGSKIEYFSIDFPPGSHGLLRVALMYGQKKIYPYDENEWMRGDNTSKEFSDNYPLPETPCRLIVRAENDDDTYGHGFFLWLKTAPVESGAKVKFRVTEDGFIEVEA